MERPLMLMATSLRTASVAVAILAGHIVIHLRVQCSYSVDLLQRIQQATLLRGHIRGTISEQLVEKFLRNGRLFALKQWGSSCLPLMLEHTWKS